MLNSPITVYILLALALGGLVLLGVVIAMGTGALAWLQFRKPTRALAVAGALGGPPPKNDIVSKRNRWSARLWRLFKAVWWWPFAALFLYGFFTNRAIYQGTLVVLSFAFQIIFALLYAIIQFGAIFWFMSRSKVEVIKPEDQKAVTFNDYWGQPTLLRLVKQWISLLSDREQFVKMGGQYINGILLYGPPGTGKTMLAKAMAGEAGVPFISIEGSGFRAMFWGVDVLKMIWFCNKAKKLAREYGACIAYIDEIDAVGASRGGVMGSAMPMFGGGSGSLTRLLYEMDGIGEQTRWERWMGRLYKFFGSSAPARTWHVLYMGSTNRPDVLDPALVRPGRFDQKIMVEPPDKAGRREVVKGYLSKVRYDMTVNIEAIVDDTPNYTPAQISAAITKDAVRIALFNGRPKISQRDIDQALQEQAFGIEHPIEEWDEEQRAMVAYHEAGHAVVQHYLMPDQRIVRVTIVRRGGALGYMMPVDRVEVHAQPLRRYAADIMVALAGDVAVRLYTGERWDGTWGDYRSVRRNIWMLYTLGYFGPPVRGVDGTTGGGGIPSNADPVIDRFWKVLEEQTETLLRQHYDELEAIGQALLEKNDLSHDEVMALLGDNGWRVDQPRGVAPRREAPAALLPGLASLPAPALMAKAEAPVVMAPAEPVAPPPSPTASRPARMITPPRPGSLRRAKNVEEGK